VIALSGNSRASGSKSQKKQGKICAKKSGQQKPAKEQGQKSIKWGIL
jgi:hypothetical protein